MKKASRDLRKYFRPLKKWFNKELPESSYGVDCSFAKAISEWDEMARHYLPLNHPARQCGKFCCKQKEAGR